MRDKRVSATKASAKEKKRLRTFSQWAASIPFTWVILGVILTTAILQIAFHASVSRLVDDAFSISFDSVVIQHHWFSSITSTLFAAKPLHLFIIVPIIVIGLGIAERLMGSWRTALVYLGVAIIASGLGILLQGIGLWLGIIAAEAVRYSHTVDPLIPIVGTIMAASAFAGPLLRRRIRVLGFAALLMFVLYSGLPSDLYRFLAALTGLVLGLLLNRQPIKFNWRRSSHHELRSLLAALVAITALGPLVALASPLGFGPLQPLGLLFRSPFEDYASTISQCTVNNYSVECSQAFEASRLGGVGPILLTLLPLTVLVVASWGILRGRRVALWLAVVTNVFLSMLAAVYFGFFPAIGANTFFVFADGEFDQYSISIIVSIALPLAVAGLLIACFRIFPTHFYTGATLRFFATISTAFLSISLIYLLIAWSLRDQFTPVVSFVDLLVDLPERFLPVGFLSFERVDVFPVGVVARIAYEWVGPFFWLVVIGTAVLAISRFQLRPAANPPSRIRALLHGGVGGSLSWMTTWAGHHYWFSADAEAAVAYRVINGVAIATGEPLCSEAKKASAIHEFIQFAFTHGWTPVFYAIAENRRPFFAEMHWSMLQVAEEAVLRPGAWTLEGKKLQDIRTSIHKAAKFGIRAEWTTYHQLSPVLIGHLKEISELWVAEKNLPEMGFTLGGLDELTDPEVKLMIAMDAHDQVLGVTSWLPSFREGKVVGWTLDFMRRRPHGMNGIMEFIIAECILRAKEEGIEFISLSAAPLAQTVSSAEKAPSAVLTVLGRALEPVYGFQSLLAFKQKFRPEKNPLYLAYADPLTLPAVGVSLARAYLPTLSARQALALLAGTA